MQTGAVRRSCSHTRILTPPVLMPLETDLTVAAEAEEAIEHAFFFLKVAKLPKNVCQRLKFQKLSDLL